MIILKIIIKKKFKLFVAKKEATEKTSLDKKSLKIEKKICFKRWKEEKWWGRKRAELQKQIRKII